MTPGDFKLAYDLGKEGIKPLQKVRDQTKRSDPIYAEIDKLYDIISGMKDSINDAKDKYFELSIEKMELQDKLNKIDEWEDIENQYILEEESPGTFLYSSKNSPFHYACPNCFSKKEKSIMQKTNDDEFGKFYLCQNCDKTINIHR